MAAASGVIAKGSRYYQLLFSPDYGTDHQLFVPTDSGVFASTNGGDSFTVLDATMNNPTPGTPVVYTGGAGTLAPLFSGKRRFVMSAGRQPSRYDLAAGWSHRVVGAGPNVVLFFVPPDRAAPTAPVLAVTYNATADVQTTGYVVWTCDDDVTCPQQRESIPVGVGIDGLRWLPLPGHRASLVLMASKGHSPSAFLSDDVAVSFHPWASLNALVGSAEHSGLRHIRLGLATNSDLPGRVYARVVGDSTTTGFTWPAKAQPHEQLFRSDNGGQTWTRVGYQLGLHQKGHRGNLPWSRPAYGHGWGKDEPIALAPDGRVLVPAASEMETVKEYSVSAGVFCSLDNGRSWKTFCPR